MCESLPGLLRKPAGMDKHNFSAEVNIRPDVPKSCSFTARNRWRKDDTEKVPLQTFPEFLKIQFDAKSDCIYAQW